MGIRIFNFFIKTLAKVYLIKVKVLNYFSPNTLEYIFEKNSFETKYLDETIIAIFQKSENKVKPNLPNDFIEHIVFLYKIWIRDKIKLIQRIPNKIIKLTSVKP